MRNVTNKVVCENQKNLILDFLRKCFSNGCSCVKYLRVPITGCFPINCIFVHDGTDFFYSIAITHFFQFFIFSLSDEASSMRNPHCMGCFTIFQSQKEWLVYIVKSYQTDLEFSSQNCGTGCRSWTNKQDHIWYFCTKKINGILPIDSLW